MFVGELKTIETKRIMMMEAIIDRVKIFEEVILKTDFREQDIQIVPSNQCFLMFAFCFPR